MKLPVDQTLKTILGEDVAVPVGDGQPTIPMTFAMAVQNALLGSLRGDEPLDGASKLELHRIATKTLDPDSDYAVEDVAKIKERVGRAFGPVIVGPVWEMIEAAGKSEGQS